MWFDSVTQMSCGVAILLVWSEGGAGYRCQSAVMMRLQRLNDACTLCTQAMKSSSMSFFRISTWHALRPDSFAFVSSSRSNFPIFVIKFSGVQMCSAVLQLSEEEVGGSITHSSCLQTLVFEWKSALNFNPCIKFKTFRHLTTSSFRPIPTLLQGSKSPFSHRLCWSSLQVLRMWYNESVSDLFFLDLMFSAKYFHHIGFIAAGGFTDYTYGPCYGTAKLQRTDF